MQLEKKLIKIYYRIIKLTKKKKRKHAGLKIPGSPAHLARP